MSGIVEPARREWRGLSLERLDERTITNTNGNSRLVIDYTQYGQDTRMLLWSATLRIWDG